MDPTHVVGANVSCVRLVTVVEQPENYTGVFDVHYLYYRMAQRPRWRVQVLLGLLQRRTRFPTPLGEGRGMA